MNLIDKDDLVSKIYKRRHKNFISGGSPSSEYCYEDDQIISIINTLEVKEVDYINWEDLKLLQDISHEVFAEVATGSVDYYQIYPTEQSFLEEVLKRFKAQKGKRV